MKPLSPMLYARRNKKKTILSINSILIAVIFLYILHSIIQCISNFQERNIVSMYKDMSTVSSVDGSEIDKTFIDKLSNMEEVDRIIQCSRYSLRYMIPGCVDNSIILVLNKMDVDYTVEKLDVKVIEGTLPRDGEKEIAISLEIAKNRGVVIGDYVGSEVDKYDSIQGKYKIVGIIESKGVPSIVIDSKNNRRDKGLIFSKNNMKDNLDEKIELLSNDSIYVSTYKTQVEQFKKIFQALKVFDVISLLSIFVIVITVSCSKFAQFFMRKDEIGILNALGYTKNKIVKRAFIEVLITNSVGFILGIVLALIITVVVGIYVWSPMGVTPVIFNLKGLLTSMLIPLFSTLATIIPINNIINNVSPINIIEKV